MRPLKRKSRARSLFLIVLSLILVFVSCGCAGDNQSAGGSSGQTAGVSSGSGAISDGTVAIYSSFPTLPALEYPSYMSEGYACQIREYTDYSQPLEALAAGEADICVAPLPAVLEAHLGGVPVKILCNFYQMGSSVVASPSLNISSIEGLSGKTVGYTEGTMEYALLRVQLYNSGIDSSLITWKEMDPSQLNDALRSGEIDAYCGDASLAGTAFSQGYGKLLPYPYSSDLGYGNLVLVTTDSAIEEKSDWIQEIVNANYQVMEMATPMEDYGLSAAESLGLDPEGVALEKDNYQWYWDMEEEYVMFTRNLCNYFLQLGIFDEMPDMDQLFDFSFLEVRSQEFIK